jgi:hypothetical protein
MDSRLTVDQLDLQPLPLLVVDLPLTISKLVLKLDSTKELLNNQPTTATTLTQLLMLSKTNSLTPTKVLVNGGKSHSTKNTG